MGLMIGAKPVCPCVQIPCSSHPVLSLPKSENPSIQTPRARSSAVEHLTFNQVVVGSIPTGLTIDPQTKFSPQKIRNPHLDSCRVSAR
jgi:hypothetical protein